MHPSQNITLDQPKYWALSLALAMLLSSLPTRDAFAESAEVLGLSAYRKQVEEQSPELKGAQMAKSGAHLAAKDSERITDTQVIANASYNDDRRPTTNPAFQGSRTEMSSANIGLQKQFLSGPKLELTQNFSRTEIFNASPVSVPLSDYYDSYPKLSLVVPLWQNFWGAKTKAQETSLKSQAEIQTLNSDIGLINANARIEMAFYNLAAAQETLKIRQEILDRAKRISSWVSSQQQRRLVDDVDSYQAEAALKTRSIELQQAENNLKVASREFNSLRGVDSSEVKEVLNTEPLNLADLQISEKQNRTRKDLAAQKSSLEISKSNSTSQREDDKPKLDLNVQAQWNGRDDRFSTAYDESYSKDQRLMYVGLQFSMPIDQGKYSDARQGHRQLARAIELKQESLDRDTQKVWQDFVEQGHLLRNQVELARELEQVQKKKADAERSRLQRGRSTTFQVLNFEQDYSSAKSQRINTELKAREFLTFKPMFD